MTADKVVVAPDERTVIGIAFGNSYSSIAVTVDDSAVVIANEDGGEADLLSQLRVLSPCCC